MTVPPLPQVETNKGVAAIVLAAAIWGLSTLFYKLLSHVSTIEILAHRTLWSLIIFAAVLLLQGRIGTLAQALRQRRSFLPILLAAITISLNWYVFIYAIQLGHTMETSLGYFIFPLLAVVLGALLFSERLGRAQRVAVALAVLAVVILTVGLGVAPWIALMLATSFGLYGVIKKGLGVGPVVSVTAEVLLLSPIAIVVLALIHRDGNGAFGGNLADSALLAFSGLITALPLILLSYAARRVTLATVGLVQYLNPSLQFLVATFIFSEPFTPWHAIAFPMIWVALAIYTIASLRQDRALRRVSSAPDTSSTTR